MRTYAEYHLRRPRTSKEKTMGRPLNKRYFGAPTTAGDEIKIQFHNGTSSVNGYIVKQLGSKKFRCTDGIIEKDCFLVDKAAGTIAAGEMSIVVKDDAGAVKQVTKISGRKVTLDSGASIAWNFSDATDDAAVEMEEAGNAGVAAVAVIAVTAANPGNVTTGAAHGLVTGDRVRFAGVVGMVELNANVVYAATVIDTTHFTIGVNTTGYTTYVSGGTVTQVEADADVFEAD